MDDARTLLGRIPALQRRADLDLLVFFARHRRTLMTNEQLARLLGCELSAIAPSLDVLLRSGLLTRTQHTSLAARMYVLDTADGNRQWLREFVAFASTREGRLALRQVMIESPRGADDDPATPAEDDGNARADERPSSVRRSAAAGVQGWSDAQREEKR